MGLRSYVSKLGRSRRSNIFNDLLLICLQMASCGGSYGSAGRTEHPAWGGRELGLRVLLPGRGSQGRGTSAWTLQLRSGGSRAVGRPCWPSGWTSSVVQAGFLWGHCFSWISHLQIVTDVLGSPELAGTSLTAKAGVGT